MESPDRVKMEIFPYDDSANPVYVANGSEMRVLKKDVENSTVTLEISENIYHAFGEITSYRNRAFRILINDRELFTGCMWPNVASNPPFLKYYLIENMGTDNTAIMSYFTNGKEAVPDSCQRKLDKFVKALNKVNAK